MDATSRTTPRRSLRRALLALTSLSLVTAACGTSTGTGTAPTTGAPTTSVDTGAPHDSSELDGFVRDITEWERLAPPPVDLGRHAVSEAAQVEETVEQEAYLCTTQTYSLRESPREVVLADSTAGQIWPGSIVDGAAHVQGSIRPVAIDQRNRAPLGISVAGGGVLGIRSGVSTVVDQPTGSTVREGVNQLVANALDSDVATGAGYSSFESVESHSAEQTLLDLGLSGRYLGHKASASLHYGHNASEHTYTAYFIQRLYTITVDAPQVPSDFFAPTVTPNELTDIGIGPDNPPLYVGSVSYGRILMYSITSSDSAEQIEGAIAYSYDSLAGGVDAEVAASYEATLSDARIEVMAVGGPNAGVENLIVSGNLSDYFEEDLQLNQVEPIAFTLHRLSDNQVAEVVDATEYEQKTCGLVSTQLARPIHWWTLDGTLDDAVGEAVMGGVNEEYGAGRWGQAFPFDGAVGSANAAGWIDGEYVERLVPTDGPFTVSAWINPRTTALGTVVSQVGATPETGDMSIRVAGGRLYFFRRPAAGDLSVDNSSTPAADENGNPVIPLNQWTHVTVVYGAEAATSIQLYVNGVDRTGSLEPSRYTGLAGGTMTRIGTGEIRPSDSGATQHQHPFDGSLDEIMIFDRALDAEEVAVMHQNFGDYKS